MPRSPSRPSPPCGRWASIQRIERVDLGRRHAQAELRATPDDVLGGLRPFLLDEIAHLRLGQRVAEPPSRDPPGVSPSQAHGGRACHRRARADRRRRSRGRDRSGGGPRPERRRPSTGKSPPGSGAFAVQPLFRRRLRQRALEVAQHLLGEPPVGRDLAAEDRDDGRRVARRVGLEHVVARRRLRFARAVVVERADAGIAPDDVGDRDGLARNSPTPRGRDSRLPRREADTLRGIAVIVAVGGADQREVALEGNGEDDAPVRVLKDVGAVVVVELRARRCAIPAPAARAPSASAPARSAITFSTQGPAALTSARQRSVSTAPVRASRTRTVHVRPRARRSRRPRAFGRRRRGRPRRAR